MKNKLCNINKMMIAFLDVFIIINMIMPYSFAALHPAIATVVKGFIVAVQIIVTGFFTIKFTIVGIQYFTASAAQEKAENKKKVKWTLYFGVLAYLSIFLFSYAVGL